ncbi:hypothetical protein BJY01DRAFT_202472 [Aspergillus pseudoustus]|uniref:Uncharacterized protein n=1 Tax=Aspergillus pseudoustus TaxID=1810923 RepID=A0ABR4KY89_9EURO
MTGMAMRKTSHRLNSVEELAWTHPRPGRRTMVRSMLMRKCFKSPMRPSSLCQFLTAGWFGSSNSPNRFQLNPVPMGRDSSRVRRHPSGTFAVTDKVSMWDIACGFLTSSRSSAWKSPAQTEGANSIEIHMPSDDFDHLGRQFRKACCKYGEFVELFTQVVNFPGSWRHLENGCSN